jgi:hypothetical protein
MHQVNGGCHCGNIRLDIELTRAPGEYSPRACDCDFCRKHGAAYISDAHGSLVIRIRDERERGMYRQGSGMAECLLCRNCGVLVGACYRSDGRLYAAVNAKVVDAGTAFAAEQSVSPKQLSAGQKTDRWKAIWFSDVRIVPSESARSDL